MGMDIAFNREQAVAAGITTETINDSDQEKFTTLVQVPGMDWWVEDTGASEQIMVRANKWGRTYEPLTEWLKAHGIEWVEL